MSCELWQAQLDAYADDSCSPAELAALEEHLRTCPACATEALARVQAKRMTRAAATRYAPSPVFRLKIEKSIQKSGNPAWALFKGRAWLPRLATAAIALVLIVASVFAWTNHIAREQAFAELLDLHVATMASANPVDVVSTDRHTVKPWFQGKLPFTFNLPELQDTPFKLIGGKMMYFEHTPGAQLLYEVRKHQLSVFIFQEGSGVKLPGTNPGTNTAREQGFAMESWTHAGLRYVIVSDTTPSDIHALGELLRAAAGS